MPGSNNKPQDLNQLRKVRRQKLAELIEAGENPYEEVTYDQTEHTKQIKDNYEQYEGKNVSIAGRLMAKRVMGKASFANLQDRDGDIQLYVSRDDLGEDYKKFKRLDIGDIIGVKGFVFTTKMGEKSVHVKSIKLLSKSLQILPEKFHGLTDPDLRYRQRYVDLIMNPDVKETFIKRSHIIAAIRRYLNERDFLEVETPILVDNAGGAAARPFVTHFNALNEDKKLRISLELYLKRLIVGGLERVYEIGRVFRNEGIDMKHNPEFTLMELYQAYTDYNGMMELTEDMYRHVCQEVNGTTVITYKGNEIDLGKPFAKMTMTEAVKKYSGVDFDEIKTLDEARQAAKEKNVEIEDRFQIGDILNAFFDAFVEENLIQPTFITGHPIEISPLTKKDPEHPGKVLRFEMYINGWEMCNAYSELNDPIDQRERFAAEEKRLAQGDEEANHTDEDFLNALEIGMPPTGGIGYGIDRMCMLLTGAENIRDVLLFPTMKSLDKDTTDKPAAKNEAEESTSGSADDAKGYFTPNDKIDFNGVKVEDFLADQVDFETFEKSDFRAVKVKDCKAVPKSKKLLQFTLDDGTGTDRTILSGIHKWYEPEDLIGKTLIAIVNLPPRKMMGIDSCGMIISAVDEKNEEEDLHVLIVDNHIPAGAKLC